MFRDFDNDLPRDQDYEGFHVYIADKAHLHWEIRTLDGSALPKVLEGRWTNVERAKEAINAHLKLEPSTKVYA